MMKPGELIENAIWLDGTETPDQRRAYQTLITEAISETCAHHGMEHGPVTFVEKRPGDDRVPPVPKHIEKKAGSLTEIRLLVAEALITGPAIQEQENRFIFNLEYKDLLRLRAITRSAWQRMAPAAPLLTDAECDEVIEQIGPDAAVDALRKHTVVSQYH